MNATTIVIARAKGGRLAAMAFAVLATVTGSSELRSEGAQRPAAPPQPRSAAPADQITRTAEIRGRVIRADTGEPLRGVRIEAGSQITDQFTDAGGRFAFTALAPGRYSLTASKGGFLTQRYGARAGVQGGFGVPIELAAGQRVEQVDFALPKGGVVSGQVIDGRGQQVSGADVFLVRWRWDRGRRYLEELEGSRDQTDDLGEFRLFGVQPDTYLLAINAPSPLAAGRMQVYYPSAYAPSDGQALSIAPGGDLSGLVVLLPLTRGGAISGVVRRADGRTVDGLSVVAEPAGSGTSSGSGASTTVAPDGSFVFPALPPGEHILRVGTDRLSATARVVLEGSDVVVPLVMSAGHSLRGRFVFDVPPPVAPAPPVGRPLFSILPADEYARVPTSNWTTRADWTFEVTGLQGQYRLQPPAPSGWFVKAVRSGGSDITDAPIHVDGSDVNGVEVVLTQRVTRVSGSVNARRPDTLVSAVIVVFAEDRSRWWPAVRFVRTTRTDAAGRFTMSDLPPARYLAVAVDDLEPQEATNPEMLEQLRRVATSFTLAEGGSSTLELTVADRGVERRGDR